MKLTSKIVAVFLVGIVLLTAVHGFLIAQREDRQLKREREEEAHALSQSMEDRFTAALREKQHETVAAMVSNANRRHRDYSIRWVALNVEGDAQETAISISELRVARAGQIHSTTRQDGDGAHTTAHVLPDRCG